VLFISWIVGHLWAAGLIVAGVPLRMVAYPAHRGVFQQLGFALVFRGGLPAARAMVKSRAAAASAHAGEPSVPAS
jgi:hypothetical protein